MEATKRKKTVAEKRKTSKKGVGANTLASKAAKKVAKGYDSLGTKRSREWNAWRNKAMANIETKNKKERAAYIKKARANFEKKFGRFLHKVPASIRKSRIQ